MIGKILVVQHATDGHGNYVACKPIERIITHVYMNDKVRDNSGEVWKVRAGADNRYYTQIEV